MEGAEEQPIAPDLTSGLAALARALQENPAARLDLLLAAARAWTGAEQALLAVFGSEGPVVRGRSGALPGNASLPDVAVELSIRSGASVRHDTAAGTVIAAPVYAETEVAGMLEVRSGPSAILEQSAMPALQILAGVVGSALAADFSGGVRGASSGSPQAYALHDPLTGLPGRALLFDRLHQAIQLARREEAPLAVLLVALTHFHDLAARLDPDSAQVVLQEFAKRTRAILRASDTVARADEERLAILLPGANAIGALGTAKKILRTVGAPFPLAGQHISLQANAGLALFPEHGEDAETLLARAGGALQQARDAGIPSQTYGE